MGGREECCGVGRTDVICLCVEGEARGVRGGRPDESSSHDCAISLYTVWDGVVPEAGLGGGRAGYTRSRQ